MVRRLCLYCCSAVAALVVALSAGPAGGAAAEREGSTCRALTAELIGSLDKMRARLLTDIEYEGYVRRVEALRPVAERMPVSRMDLACLNGAAWFAEEAFNEYVYASLPWTECLESAACDLETVGPTVALKWWVAGALVSDAHASL